MTVRTISAGELATFADFGADTDRCNQLRAYLERLWNTDASRPEWCFVCEHEKYIVGRLAWWGAPGSQRPSVADFLDVAIRGDEEAIACKLVDASLARLPLAGERITAIVDDPSALYPEPERIVRLLEGCGFELERVTRRWEWTPASGAPGLSARLAFRSFEDVGEEQFVAALARVLIGTLDRALRASLRKLDATQATREQWEQLAALEHEPRWYQLAFGPAGELVGLIAPARNADGRPIIALVGVVPEQRGHRYVDDLLAEATEILASTGATTVHADADIENGPMLAAFQRGRYREFARRKEFVLTA